MRKRTQKKDSTKIHSDDITITKKFEKYLLSSFDPNTDNFLIENTIKDLGIKVVEITEVVINAMETVNYSEKKESKTSENFDKNIISVFFKHLESTCSLSSEKPLERIALILRHIFQRIVRFLIDYVISHDACLCGRKECRIETNRQLCYEKIRFIKETERIIVDSLMKIDENFMHCVVG